MWYFTLVNLFYLWRSFVACCVVFSQKWQSFITRSFSILAVLLIKNDSNHVEDFLGIQCIIDGVVGGFKWASGSAKWILNTKAWRDLRGNIVMFSKMTDSDSSTICWKCVCEWNKLSDSDDTAETWVSSLARLIWRVRAAVYSFYRIREGREEGESDLLYSQKGWGVTGLHPTPTVKSILSAVTPIPCA